MTIKLSRAVTAKALADLQIAVKLQLGSLGPRGRDPLRVELQTFEAQLALIYRDYPMPDEPAQEENDVEAADNNPPCEKYFVHLSLVYLLNDYYLDKFATLFKHHSQYNAAKHALQEWAGATRWNILRPAVLVEITSIDNAPDAELNCLQRLQQMQNVPPNLLTFIKKTDDEMLRLIEILTSAIKYPEIPINPSGDQRLPESLLLYIPQLKNYLNKLNRHFCREHIPHFVPKNRNGAENEDDNEEDVLTALVKQWIEPSAHQRRTPSPEPDFATVVLDEEELGIDSDYLVEQDILITVIMDIVHFAIRHERAKTYSEGEAYLLEHPEKRGTLLSYLSSGILLLAQIDPSKSAYLNKRQHFKNHATVVEEILSKTVTARKKNLAEKLSEITLEALTTKIVNTHFNPQPNVMSDTMIEAAGVASDDEDAMPHSDFRLTKRH